MPSTPTYILYPTKNLTSWLPLLLAASLLPKDSQVCVTPCHVSVLMGAMC